MPSETVDRMLSLEFTYSQGLVNGPNWERCCDRQI